MRCADTSTGPDLRRGAALVGVVLALLAGPAAAQPVAEPVVTATGAVLFDPADDKVLWGRAERRPLPPASTTKVMTVLLALEAGTIDETVTVSAAAVEIGRRPGAATLGLTVGQRIPMRSLLAGLILRSGNDAAVAVAEHVAGSEAAFVTLMNERADELGLADTSFINASGLTDDPAHHASALDLARLAEVALADDDFAAWARASTLEIPGLGVLESRNELLRRYPGATGVKTGYTNLAGLCLVASARRDGRPLIGVVLGSDDAAADQSFVDTIRMFDYGYTAFERPNPARAGRRVARYRWDDVTVPLVADEDLARTVSAGAPVFWRIVADPDARRPVPAGAPLGRAELVLDGEVVDTTPLLAGRGAPEPPELAPPAAAGAAVEEAVRAFARLYSVHREV